MTPFKLPDLVLGVSIVADTSGARKAARDLKNAVNQEMGKGTGGGGRGGGGGGAFTGSMLGSSIGSNLGSGIGKGFTGVGGRYSANQVARSLNAYKRNWIAQNGLDLMQIDVLRRMKTGFGGAWRKGEIEHRSKWSPDFTSRGKAAIPRLPATDISRIGAMSPAFGTGAWNKTLAAQSKSMAKSMAAATKSTIAKAAGGRAASNAMSVGMMSAMARGNITGVLLRFGRMFWPLLIVALGYMIFSKLVLPAVKSAFGYIRKSGVTGGVFGEFGQQASMTPVLLRNVEVQFGLMAIQLMDLGKFMENFNLILLRLSGTFDWLSKSPLVKILTAGLVFNPKIWEFWEFLSRFLPGEPGGKDLGTGSTGRLGGAFVEGSVEAYRTIQGTMSRYAAETARNTKAISDDMKKVLRRGQDMGVVVG